MNCFLTFLDLFSFEYQTFSPDEVVPVESLEEGLGGPEPAGEEVGEREGGDQSEVESEDDHLVLTEGTGHRGPTKH